MEDMDLPPMDSYSDYEYEAEEEEEEDNNLDNQDNRLDVWRKKVTRWILISMILHSIHIIK